MKELTMDEFMALPFVYMSGLRYSTGTQRCYRNEEHGLRIEVVTTFRKSTMGWGEGKTYYFIDGDARQFTDVAEWYMAYMHKVCGLAETPLYEVKA